MGRSHTRLPTFCATPATSCVRVHFLPLQSKSTSSSIKSHAKTHQFSGNIREENLKSKSARTGCGIGNRIMVVVDSSCEAEGALQWALSHTVQSQDTIVLLYVTKCSKQGPDSRRKLNLIRAYEILYSMKNMCQVRKPGVHVEVAMLEGKEKGPIIVEEAKQQRVSLLVLGQRKRSMLWCIMRIWASNRIRSSGVVEYCIQNANCMTIAVRRKSNKLGGYLITTKRHKNFWLLA